ncbi:TolC family protein [Tellurirhabdus rosea]|uniref:TolC family protein n=1 Tax=Tellurirhabdus rosea TaxID=2674997 RepID=UPI002253B923|nr:TolC family protein [Tellurirhabdus rosea]
MGLTSLLAASLNLSIAQSLNRLSLADALRLAEQNRIEVKVQQTQVQLAGNQEAIRRAAWLPQVNAGADIRWNTQIQRNIIPNAPFANGQDVVLRFGTPINNLLNAQAEQKIYDAQSRIDRQLNQTAVQTQEVILERQRQDIRSQVTEAYYGAVFNREKLRLSEAARQRAEGYLEQARTRYGAGTLLQTDLSRFELDLRNADLSRRNDQRDYTLSLETLRYRLNLPDGQTVVPADSLRQLFGQPTPVDANTAARLELKQEDLTRQTALLNGRRQRAQLSPVVSAYGAYFLQQLHDTFNPFASGTWFPYNYLGVRLNVPLFDGRQARLNERQNGLQAQISQQNRQRLQNDFDYELKTAQNTLAQARDNLAETERNIAQARAILAIDRVRFDAGTLLLADFRNSEYTLQQAENNYLQAVYNVLSGQLAVRRATGNL